MSSEQSEENARLLEHEAFMAEAIRLRANADARPRWQRFLEAGGTVLLSAILGGAFSLSTTLYVQKASSERESAKARSDKIIIALKEYLDREREAEKRVGELVGNSVAAADDLITLTAPEFDLDNFVGVDRENVKRQRNTIRETYNKADAQWRSEEEKLGLQMGFLNRRESDVIGSWRSTQHAVTTYMDCAQQWYVRNQAPVDPTGACKNEKETFRKFLDQLTSSLMTERRLAEAELNKPDSSQ